MLCVLKLHGRVPLAVCCPLPQVLSNTDIKRKVASAYPYADWLAAEVRPKLSRDCPTTLSASSWKLPCTSLKLLDQNCVNIPHRKRGCCQE